MSCAFLECAAERGLAQSELSLDRLEGVGLVRLTQRRGLRNTAADAYLKPARRRDNLTVATDAQALRVEFEAGRATGVRYRQGGAERVANATREVILCAGAIGSPQLLMLSGVGPADALRELDIRPVHDLPGVGRNLQDHCMAITLYDASGDQSCMRQRSRPSCCACCFAAGMLTSNVAEAAAFVRTREELEAPDLEIMFGPVLYLEEGLVPAPSHGFSIAAVVLQPRSRGELRLGSADPLAPPEIDPKLPRRSRGRTRARPRRRARA